MQSISAGSRDEIAVVLRLRDVGEPLKVYLDDT